MKKNKVLIFSSFLVFFVCLFLVFNHVKQVNAADGIYYVDNQAIGDNSGSSWTNAWQSFAFIRWADVTTAAQNGSVHIYVKRGNEFNETLNIQASGTSQANRIYITTHPDDTGNAPLIDMQNTGNRGIRINGDFITVQNFEITDCVSSGVLFDSDADYITLSNLEIHDMQAAGVYDYNGCDYGIIENCKVYNISNRDDNPYDGIQVGGEGWIVRNNIIYNINEDGLELGGTNAQVYGNDISRMGYGSLDHTVTHPDAFITGVTGLVFRDNYIHDTPSQGFYVVAFNGNSGDLLVYNNVFYNVGGGHGAINITAETGSLIGYCRILNNTFIKYNGN